MSFYLAPDDPKQYLGDFKKFELRPKTEKLRSALVTLMIIIGVWLAFIGSFIFYLRAIIN
jgi:hypothetical protein